MESFGINGLTVSGMLLASSVLGISIWRSLRRRRGKAATPAPRIEALAAAQADLEARVEALASQDGPEERLQEMAGQLLGLVRDKNATLETALAGLDQLRERMHALERMGEPAEARALLERLEARLEDIRSTQAASAAALEARMTAFEASSENPVADLAERLSQLHSQKDTLAQTALGRIADLERTMAERDPEPALQRFAEQLEETRRFMDARLAPLESKLGEMEARLGDQDPQARLERFAERLEALKESHAAAETALAERVAALEEPGENPFAEISDQLTRLYAQKDAALEALLSRLGPVSKTHLRAHETNKSNSNPDIG